METYFNFFTKLYIVQCSCQNYKVQVISSEINEKKINEK